MKSASDTTPNAANAQTPTVVVATIAMPPPLGVGTTCELRSFGTSSTPRANASLRTRPVKKYATDPTSAAINQTSRDTGFQLREKPTNRSRQRLVHRDRGSP